MLRRIKANTGYDLVIMKDHEQWLLETLLGEGLASKEIRRIVGDISRGRVAVARAIIESGLGSSHFT